MKKIIVILVLLMCISLPMTAYAQSAQSEIDAANEQAAADAANRQTVIDVDYGVLAQQEAMENENNLSRYADGAVGRGTVENPYEYWETNGYPNNISFAFDPSGEILLDDGTSVAYFEIGIVNADDASKQDIIDLFSPNCFITFRDCTWSYSQRKAAFNEINASRNDIVRNVVMGTNSEIVIVEIADGYEKEYAQRYIEAYGAFVVVTNDIPTAADGAMAGSGLGIPVTHTQPLYQNNWILPTILILLCVVAITLYFNRTRFIPAMQTNTGNVVTGNTKISRKQTIALVKNSALTPSDDVFKAIMEKIDATKSDTELNK